MTVSVVIPHYNSFGLLSETVNSVRMQTHRELELIIVDDGSTDGSWADIQRLPETDRRIRVFRKPNGGQASARNLGIAKASGDFIALLDADDLWSQDKIEKQLAVFEQDPEVQICFTGTLIFDGQIENTRSFTSLPYAGKLSGKTFFNRLFEASAITNSSALIRRTVFENTGALNESEVLRGTEDYEFWLRCARKNLAFYGLNEPLTFYREHTGGIHRQQFRMYNGKRHIYNSYLDDTWLEKQVRIKQMRFACRNAIIYALEEKQQDQIPEIHQDLKRTDQSLSAQIQGFLLKILPAKAAGFLLRKCIYQIAYKIEARSKQNHDIYPEI